MSQFYFNLLILILIQYPNRIHLKTSPLRVDISGLHFSLKCNEETGILAVHECISACRNLHVRLSHRGLFILLPQWFRYKNNCTFNKFSMHVNFVSYLVIIQATVLSEISKLSKRFKFSECQLKLVATESGIEHDDYLQQLFHGCTPRIALRQKQPPDVFCKKSCSQKFRKIHRKTPVLEPFLLKKRLWHWCFPVNLPKFLRILFFTEHIWTTASLA